MAEKKITVIVKNSKGETQEKLDVDAFAYAQDFKYREKLATRIKACVWVAALTEK